MAQTTTNHEDGKSASRREEILAVAAKVIAERGIKEATVRDIGEAAGILSGSLYYHFDSKEQIVVELLLPGIKQAHANSQVICAKSNGLAAVADLIRDAILTTSQQPDRSIILRNEARIFSELPSLAEVHAFRAEIIEMWINAVSEGIAAGEIRTAVEPQIVVRSILDGVLGASRWFCGPSKLEPAAVVESLIDFYLGGLKQH